MSALLCRLSKTLWWVPFGRVPEIKAAELHARLNGPSPPQLLDVRTTLEWRKSRIAGAVHVPITKLRRRLDGLGLDPKRPIVAICLTGHRSVPAVRLLHSQGFAEAVHLAGGMTAWWRDELPSDGGDPGSGPEPAHRVRGQLPADRHDHGSS